MRVMRSQLKWRFVISLKNRRTIHEITRMEHEKELFVRFVSCVFVDRINVVSLMRQD